MLQDLFGIVVVLFGITSIICMIYICWLIGIYIAN